VPRVGIKKPSALESFADQVKHRARSERAVSKHHRHSLVVAHTLRDPWNPQHIDGLPSELRGLSDVPPVRRLARVSSSQPTKVVTVSGGSRAIA
jgi:hypothetical protein